MFNRSALSRNLPPAIVPTIPPGMATGIHSPRADDLPLVGRFGWQRVSGFFRLPTTLRGYTAFLAGLIVLAFTMTLHIILSAEIMSLDVQLSNLREEYARIERYNANIVWEIAGYTALDDLHEQAVAAGYVNNIPTEYVDMPLASTAAVVDSTGDMSVSDADALLQSNPAVSQPVYHVIGEEQASGAVEERAATTTGAPRIGALGTQVTQETLPDEVASTWWDRNTPAWLRLDRVGDAIDESLDWVRAHLPSPEWLQERW